MRFAGARSTKMNSERKIPRRGCNIFYQSVTGGRWTGREGSETCRRLSCNGRIEALPRGGPLTGAALSTEGRGRRNGGLLHHQGDREGHSPIAGACEVLV